MNKKNKIKNKKNKIKNKNNQTNKIKKIKKNSVLNLKMKRLMQKIH